MQAPKKLLVVGAGPAGSVAASVLAERGHAVTLVDAARFPRDKVCGECLSALGIATLERLGLAGALEESVPLRQSAFIALSGKRLDVTLPNPMAGLTRHRLDVALQTLACRRGATLHTGTRCLSWKQGVATLQDVQTRETYSHEFDLVLLADGKGAFPEKIGRLSCRPTATGDLGIKRHLRGVDLPEATIGLFGLRGSYVGLAPVENGLFNLACGVPAGQIKAANGNLDAWLAEAMRQNPSLARALKESEAEGDWLTCPLPRFPVRTDWPGGMIPVGNAAAALEPVGGEGMGLAIASAALAAEQVSKDGMTSEGLERLRRDYARLWRTRRPACRAAVQILTRPWAAGLVISGGNLMPGLTHAAARLMGKGDATKGRTLRSKPASG